MLHEPMLRSFVQIMAANCVLALNISITMTENDFLPALYENVASLNLV